MARIIRLNSIFCIFILTSCHSNKEADVFDWSHPNKMPTYVDIDLGEVDLVNPPPLPNIELPSLADVPADPPTSQPNFTPPPLPLNFTINFGD
tara:strand:- start:1080 stop:1358 length:279 start_codon:yes stop_codon:yes gene_type:complete